jgi:hypothetical protein
MLNARCKRRGRGQAEVLRVARKAFQDFAHVLCQRFIEVPSNRDLVNLVILGGGTLALDIIGRKTTCNRFPIETLPCSEDARSWLESQMKRRKFPADELIGASLIVEYVVDLSRKQSLLVMPVAKFDFACTGSITSPDRQYTSVLKAEKTWGLSTV